MAFVVLLSSEEVSGGRWEVLAFSMNRREREREKEKEQNEKIPDPSIHLSHPSHLSISWSCLFVCLFFCCPSFFLFLALPYTLPYYPAMYLDCFLVFELELELGFEVR